MDTSKIEALKEALKTAETLAAELAAHKSAGSSGHFAATLGRVRGAQELVAFAEKAIDAAPGTAEAAETAEA